MIQIRMQQGISQDARIIRQEVFPASIKKGTLSLSASNFQLQIQKRATAFELRADPQSLDQESNDWGQLIFC